MSQPGRDPELQRLLDEAAIRRVVASYSRAIDRRDWELLASCYHAGARDEHAGFDGTAEEFVEWVQDALAPFAETKHFVGNQLVDVDGDTAWAETYCLAFHRILATADRPALDRLVSVRYCDRFERREGAWRIAHRRTVYEPGRLDPVGLEPVMGEPRLVGSHDRTDPAYQRDP